MKSEHGIWVAALLTCALTACGGSAPEESANQARVSVRTATVDTRIVQSWIYGQGSARAVKREFLTFTSEGRVTYIAPGLKVGQQVRARALLAHLEPARVSADLEGARAEAASAKAALAEAAAVSDVARLAMERFASLLRQDSASAQEFDQARAEHAQAVSAQRQAQAQFRAATAKVAQAEVIYGETRLVSPIDGVVARLNIEQGRLFSPANVQTASEQEALRTVPLLIIDPSELEIRIEVPAEFQRTLAPGASVLIGWGAQHAVTGRQDDHVGVESGPPLPEQAYQARGRVHSVGQSLDPATRTFEVRIRTSASDLQDGEFVTTWIEQIHAGKSTALPEQAVRHRDNGAFVLLVDHDKSVARERAVRLGRLGGGYYEVREGLAPGDVVVTEGRSRVSDGTAVKVIADQAGDKDKDKDHAR